MELELVNINLNHSTYQTRKLLLEKYLDSTVKLENCKFDDLDKLLENQKLKDELVSASNNPTHDFSETFRFSVTNQTRYAFARYFAGFQRFIETSKGVNIGFEIASLESEIVLTIYTGSKDDLERISEWLKEFIGQALDFNETGNLKIINSSHLSQDQMELSLVEARSRIRTLQNDLETGNFKLGNANNEILRLQNVVSEQQNTISLLYVDNEKIQEKIAEIWGKYRESCMGNQLVDDKIDILIGLFGELKLGLDSHDSGSVSKTKTRIKEFMIIHGSKIMLIPKVGKYIKTFVEEFIQ